MGRVKSLQQQLSSKDVGWVPKTEFAELVQMGQKCVADVPLNNSWRCQATLDGHGLSNSVSCLGISPDGKLLDSGSDDNTLRLWSLPDGKLLQTLSGHSSWVRHLAISPNGKLLASCSYDATVVRLWTSGLYNLSRLPIEKMRVEDMHWVQEALQDKAISKEERDWLEFIQALVHWRRRFDVEVEEAPQRIDAGEFDIEIEG